jgi:hypothetical protein
MLKKALLFSLLCLSWNTIPIKQELYAFSPSQKQNLSYPNFDNNPSIDISMSDAMRPYLLPLEHPLKPTLDHILLKENVIKNKKTLCEAGFKILFFQKRSFIIVAKHPKAPGYLFKLYLESEKRLKKGQEGWKRLTKRCIFSAKIKEIISQNNLHHFSVADKWLYPLPVSRSRHVLKQPVVLLVKDMQIFDHQRSRQEWKKRANRELLDELYCILGRGYGSIFLTGNIPYSKSGKFAFIDTEYQKRDLHLSKVKRYLSSKMKNYWGKLMKSPRPNDAEVISPFALVPST